MIRRPPEPALLALTAALDADRPSERVAVASFAVHGLTPAMSTWMSLPLGDDLLPYVQRLIREPALVEALPALAPTGATTFADPVFERLHPLSLAGSIAEVVASGGAYGSDVSMAQTLALTQQWLAQAFGERYEDLRIAHTQGAWTDWFYDVLPSWDRTWLITDLFQQHATLLCITDTD